MQVDYVDDNTPLLFMDFYLDMEIDEDNVAENLADVNSVSSYVERERFMMEKATKQINGINNLIS